MKKPIMVVRALFVKDGRILATERSESMSLPGLWEVPGGKIEPGKAFIYLGEVTPTDAVQTTMPDKDGRPLSVVTMNLALPKAIDGATFDYLTLNGA